MEKFSVKSNDPIVGSRGILSGLGAGEVGGSPGVGAKQRKNFVSQSYNPGRTTSGEAGRLKRARRGGTKAGGANGIRYPGSPSCKRCRLGVRTGTARSSAAGKPLSLPPGEYGRKAEFSSGKNRA